MAATLTADWPHAHGAVRDAGRLHLKTARELAEYSRSSDPLEASVGVAALNSLLRPDESSFVEVNAGHVLAERGAGRTVALVGHFPFVDRLRDQVGALWVIEKRPLPDEYPAEAAPDLIPRADVVAITGSALINGTLDGLLALCRPGSTVLVLGPSTPLSPILFAHGATLLSGARVADEAAALLTAAQGAGFRQMAGVRLVTMEWA
jgi:hypothetical protein